MKETMLNMKGCGLAAVQVGVLRNIILVQPEEDAEIHVLINPVILETSVEENEYTEGCLSVPDETGTVSRPNTVKVKALDENMDEFTLEASDFFFAIHVEVVCVFPLDNQHQSR